jgi:transposase-like protein
MKNPHSIRCTLTAANRAQIIQRILVDGWTTAQAAELFGVSRRLVDVWVANYRKNGMASLRREPNETIAAEFARKLQTLLRRISTGPRRSSTVVPIIQPLPMREVNRERSG